MARPYTALVRPVVPRPKPATRRKPKLRPGPERLRLWTASNIWNKIAFSEEPYCPRCWCPKSNDITEPNHRTYPCSGCRCHNEQEVA